MTSKPSAARALSRRETERSQDVFNVGVLVPTTGSMGLLGPSAYACARLACDSWNEAGGVNGRPVRITVLDSSETAFVLDHELEELLAAAALDALVVLCNTDVCERISRLVNLRIPVVFTPQFEGHGLPAWVHTIGETPDRQVLPALDWMGTHRHTRRWFLLGSDYCWPRQTHAAAKRHLYAGGASVVAERYLPLGERDFDSVIEQLSASKADAVLINLVGSDAVHMCRAFGAAGLSDRILRLSGCIEENALMGMGSRNTAGLFVAAGYFASVDSEANGSFKERYHHRFGERAPALNSQAQSVYEGFVHLRTQTLKKMTDRGTGPRSVRAAQPGYAPDKRTPIYLAETDGMKLRVIQALDGAPG